LQSLENFREALHEDILKFNDNTVKKLKIKQTTSTAMNHLAESVDIKDDKLDHKQRRWPAIKLKKIKGKKVIEEGLDQ